MLDHTPSRWKLIPAVAFTAGAVAFGGSRLYAEVSATQPADATQRDGADAATHAPAFLGVAVVERPAPAADPQRLSPVLVVSEVHPGSPADGAGVRPGDVLLKLDDQALVAPVQLARLVQDREPGSKASLTVVRDGDTQTLDATLAPRPQGLARIDQPAAGQAMPQNFRMIPADPFGDPGALGEARPVDMEQMFREMEARMQEMRQRLQNAPQMRIDLNQLAPAGPDGQPQGNVSVLTHSDGRLTVTLTTTAQGRRLKAVDNVGKVLFDGPIDTDEQMKAVPDDVRQPAPREPARRAAADRPAPRGVTRSASIYRHTPPSTRRPSARVGDFSLGRLHRRVPLQRDASYQTTRRRICLVRARSVSDRGAPCTRPTGRSRSRL